MAGSDVLASAHSWLRHGKEGLNTLCYICKQNKIGFDFHLEQPMQWQVSYAALR